MRKIVPILMFFIIALILSAQEITLEQAVEYYLNNSFTTEKRDVDMSIVDIRRKELEQKNYRNMEITLKSAFETKENNVSLNTRAGFNEFYISFTPDSGTVQNKNTLIIGAEKKLNDFLFDSKKYKMDGNLIEGKTTRIGYNKTLINDIENIINRYIAVKEIEENIEINKSGIKRKKEDVEIAKIKAQAGALGKNDVEYAESVLRKAELALDKLNIDYIEALDSFMTASGLEGIEKLKDEERSVSDIKVFVDDSDYKTALLVLEKEQSNLKAAEAENYPVGIVGGAYNVEDNNFSASLSLTFYPMNYKGGEKEAAKRIVKQQRVVEEAKKDIESKRRAALNNIKRLELTKANAYEESEIYRKELEKSGVMVEAGSESKYQYYIKEDQYKEKMAAYFKAETALKGALLKNEILSKYFSE